MDFLSNLHNTVIILLYVQLNRHCALYCFVDIYLFFVVAQLAK